MRVSFRRVADALSGFRFLALAAALFTIPNITVFFAVSLRPEILEALWLSTETPWGIITAAFLHREAGHLLQNLLNFLAAVVSFALSNLVQDRKGKERYSRIFLLAFPSGFLANAAELFVRWMSNSAGSAYGASGVVYSAIGICTVSAVINSYALMIRFVRYLRDPGIKETVPELLVMVLNLALIAFALYLILFARESFLNVSPGVDVFVHTAGFFIGFAISSALFLAERT